MLKALVWKEWREQRGIVLAGAVLAVLLPLMIGAGRSTSTGGADLFVLAGAITVATLAILWPLFAVITGASTFAHERGEGTLEFLLSRPVSRWRVWGVKVAMAAVASAMIGLVGLAILWLIAGAAGHGAPRAALRFLELQIQGGPWVSVTLALALTFLVFSASVFCSGFLTRSMTAAAAAICVAAAIVWAVFIFWSRVDLIPRFEPEWFALELTLAGLSLLVVSAVTFARLPAGSHGGRTRRTAAMIVAAVPALGIAAVAAIASLGEFGPESGRLAGGLLAPRGAGAAVALSSPTSWASSIWWLPLDGTAPWRLTGRLTWPLAIRPDGSRVVYVSASGPFGLRGDAARVRIVNADGTGDRALAFSLSLAELYMSWTGAGALGGHFEGQAVFSPDGNRVALLLYGGRLVVFSIDGEATREWALAEGSARQMRLLGWTDDGGEILVAGLKFRRGDETPLSALAAVDASTGQRRVLLDRPVQGWFCASGSAYPSPEGLRSVAFAWRESRTDRFRIDRIDVHDGNATRLTDTACTHSSAIHERSGQIGFLDCAERELTDKGGTVRVRQLRGDREETWGEIEALATNALAPIVWAPDGERIAVATQSGVRVFEQGRAVREIATDLWLAGWVGRDRIALAGDEIAIADVDTEAVRVVLPPRSEP